MSSEKCQPFCLDNMMAWHIVPFDEGHMFIHGFHVYVDEYLATHYNLYISWWRFISAEGSWRISKSVPGIEADGLTG